MLPIKINQSLYHCIIIRHTVYLAVIKMHYKPSYLFYLQTIFRVPAPLGPICSAYWQLKTGQWHIDPPLHTPEWEARKRM